jgi:outer membrane protein OmpA-like peptidoglycan-associated protein
MVNCHIILGQNAKIEGYVFEDANRGYLNMAEVKITDPATGTVFEKLFTNLEGFFTANVPAGIPLVVTITKEMFNSFSQSMTLVVGQKEFLSVRMQRLPGYVFEITIAEKRSSPDATALAVKGAHIEAYNNTTEEIVVDLPEYQSPEFKLNLLKGNHYTVMIRRDGYLTKRLEAYVNVNGCILCFEGLGDLRPGVVDNLSSNNETGVLLANVELEKYYTDKIINLRNISYDLGSANLTKESLKELDKVAFIASDNPNLTFEIGSHTDSRGSAGQNKTLSEQRSSAVEYYLINKRDVPRRQLKSKGYGETLLLNGCKDGVPCSDLDHATNRRTELKIVGIDSQYIAKSLRQLKAIENFERKMQQELKGETSSVKSQPQASMSSNPTTDISQPIKDDKLAQETKQQFTSIDSSKTVINEKPAIDPEKTRIVSEKVKDIPVSEHMTEQKANVKVITDPQTLKTSIKVRAGRFKQKGNAINIRDRVILLGYPRTRIEELDGLFVVWVDEYVRKVDALDAIKDLGNNGVDAEIADRP